MANATESLNSVVNQGEGIANIFFLLALFGVMYFFVLRPQTKRQQEHKKMIDALVVGDEVILGSGILGKITEIQEPFLRVEIASNTRVLVQRHSVVSILPRGTY